MSKTKSKSPSPRRAPNRRRRLLALAAAVVSLAVLAGGFWTYRVVTQTREDARLRAEGIAAAEAGDADTAVVRLRAYLRRNPDDAGALETYSEARPEVDDGAGERETVSVLRHLLQLRPDRDDLRQRLLALYESTGLVTEGKSLAESVLAKNPADPLALRVLTGTLERLNQTTAAADAARRWAEADPDDLAAQRTRLLLARRAGAARGDLLALTRPAVEADPDDPRADVLHAYALMLTADDPAAATRPADGVAGDPDPLVWLERAAAAKPTDPDLALSLAELLDATARTDLSLEVLRGAADAKGDAAAEADTRAARRLAIKLWQAGQWKEASARLAGDLDLPADAAGESLARLSRRDPTLVAIAADTLNRLGDAEDAGRMADALAAVERPAATAWAAYLGQQVGRPLPEAAAWAGQARDAAATLPRDATLHLMLGQAERAAGDAAAAEAALRRAGDLDPAWAAPPAELARLLAAQNRPADALAAASEAARRQPRDANTLVTLALIWDNAIGQGVDNRVDTLLRLVDQLREALPDEARLVPVQTDLLARRGDRTAAVELIDQTVAAGAVPRDVLMRLVEVSRQQDLAAEDGLLKSIRERFGVTPELARLSAEKLAEGGDAAAGLRSLREATPAGDEALDWSLAAARFAETHDLPEAAGLWNGVSEEFAARREAQLATLDSRAAADDPALAAAALDRLEAVAGEADADWQFAKARSLLALNEASADDLTRATTLLDKVLLARPNSADALLLSGNALERAGNPGTALVRLTQAHRVAPGDARATLYLADLLQRQGNFTRASQVLDEASLLPAGNDVARRQLAALLTRQGRADRAIDVLAATPATPTAGGDEGSAPAQLMLARLLLQRGEADAALERVDAVLAEPSLNAESRLTATGQRAEIQFLKGEADAARETLDSMSRIAGVDAAQASLVRAGLTLAHVGVEPALTFYKEATTASPKSGAAWRARLAALVSAGRAGEAAALVPEAAAATDDAGMNRLAERQELVAAADLRPDLRPLALNLVADPDDPAAVAALSLFTAGDGERGVDAPAGDLGVSLPAGPAAVAGRAGEVRRLAAEYPQSLPLRLLLANLLSEAGDAAGAADAAVAAATSFPSSADAARAASGAMAAAGRWPESEEYARQWAARAPLQATAANLALARAILQIGGRPGEATAALAPAAGSLLARPADLEAGDPLSAGVVLTYAAALSRAGREAEVRRVIDPLVTTAADAAEWRSAWISTAVSALPAPAAAAWLERLAGVVPPEDARQMTQLAGGWEELSRRTGDTAFSAAGQRILARLEARPDAPPEVFVLLAQQNESNGDLDSAEKMYREALARLPQETPQNSQNQSLLRAIVMNNLAMVLTRRDGAGEEAARLGRAAVALGPQVPNFRDTLAQVLWRGGEAADALVPADEAVKLAPDNLSYRVNRAQILLDAGRRDDAVAAVDSITADPDFASIEPDVRLRFEALRRRLVGPDPGAGAGADEN